MAQVNAKINPPSGGFFVQTLQRIKHHLLNNYKLSNALAKWEIVSYERMTDMIFSSYMATKSPETSGKGIIAAIEKRIK